MGQTVRIDKRDEGAGVRRWEPKGERGRPVWKGGDGGRGEASGVE